ncbi:MAG TPA: enoyl-CoA hydratase-related protein [Acidimicrobiia bacterium]|nr:enoyl-CoA hydratase-related protein [Acidimicrobiia bacterium]
MRLDDYRRLGVERDGDVLRVTMRGPGDGVEHTEWSRLFADVRGSDVRVVVITGVGEVFMPLADMAWYATVEEAEWLRLMREAKWLLSDMAALPQPIIMAMNGDAVGLGASILSYGDIIVAAEGAKISDAHMSMGLVAGDGGTMSLPLSMGLHRAKQFYLLGEPLTAEQLHEMGVVARVVPRGDLDKAVAEVTDHLLSLPDEALQWTKMTLNRTLQLSTLLTAEPALGHEGWSWHLRTAQAGMDRLRHEHGSAEGGEDLLG